MNPVNERERGLLPLSIGTSLAFESLLNQSEIITHPVAPYKQYRSVWVNVKTLFRNIHGAVPRDYQGKTTPKQYAEALLSEMFNIRDILANDADNMSVVFYLPNYQGLSKINPETLPRMDNTELQKQYSRMMKESIHLVLKEMNTQLDVNSPERIRIYDNKITDNEMQKTLMVTHYAYDLLSFRRFSDLSLLETHTGKIKGRDLWYTKYYNGRELPPLPFRLDLLTLLGDQTLFRTKVPQLKKAIIQLAKDNKWTPITTTDKIRHNIESIKDHQIRHRLLACISSSTV